MSNSQGVDYGASEPAYGRQGRGVGRARSRGRRRGPDRGGFGSSGVPGPAQCHGVQAARQQHRHQVRVLNKGYVLFVNFVNTFNTPVSSGR